MTGAEAAEPSDERNEKYAWCIYRDKQPNLSKSKSAGEGMTFQTTMVIPPSTADLPCGNIPQQFYRHPGTASRPRHAPSFSAMARSYHLCSLRFQGQSPFPITTYDDYQLERASNATTVTLFIKMLFGPRNFQVPGSPNIFRMGLGRECSHSLILPVDEKCSHGFSRIQHQLLRR